MQKVYKINVYKGEMPVFRRLIITADIGGFLPLGFLGRWQRLRGEYPLYRVLEFDAMQSKIFCAWHTQIEAQVNLSGNMGFILAKTSLIVNVAKNPKSYMAKVANISVATYTISVSKKFSRKPEPLDNFENADLFEFLLKFLKDRNSPLNDKEAKFIISANAPKVDGRQISGIVETGDYGYSSELYDTEKKQLAYHRKPADADLKPFFYLFDLPKGQTRGLVVLQRFKTFGIRGLLAGDFSKYFEKHYPNSSVHIEPIVHPKIWQQFADGGSATKIRLRKFNIPQDICDMMKHGIKPDDGYVEYSIIAKKGNTFNVLKKMLGGNPKELLMLEAPDFKPDKTLVEVTLNGRKRTLDIADITKLRTYFDVTEDVKIAKNGHPEFDSILEISKGILVDIWPLIKGAAHV
jgi:hypothetical protein